MPCCQRSREPAKLAWKARASRTASTCSRCGKQRNSHEREGCLCARLCDEPGRCEDERPEDRKRWTIGDGESRATTHFARREACAGVAGQEVGPESVGRFGPKHARAASPYRRSLPALTRLPYRTLRVHGLPRQRQSRHTIGTDPVHTLMPRGST